MTSTLKQVTTRSLAVAAMTASMADRGSISSAAVAGDDELRGGGGVGDQLYGEAGDDLLIGSDDGADMIFGGPDNDRARGQGGNDIDRRR